MSNLENTINFNPSGPENTAQFDFKNSPSDSSPFNYLVTSGAGSGCGAIRKNGKIIIETGGCEKSLFSAFITGFVNIIRSPPQQDTTASIAFIVPGPEEVFGPVPYPTPEIVDPLDDGYIFKQSAGD